MMGTSDRLKYHYSGMKAGKTDKKIINTPLFNEGISEGIRLILCYYLKNLESSGQNKRECENER